MDLLYRKQYGASEVKLIRGQLKMKQKELAGLMNVSVKTVNTGKAAGGQCRELLPPCSASCGSARGFWKSWRSRKRVPSSAQIFESEPAVHHHRCE